MTKNSFNERLALHGHEIVTDEDFAHLYSDSNGRPSHPPSVMVRALLCATHDKTSDRESARRTRVDLDWRAAMGVDDDFSGIGATTFSLFRSRLVLNEKDQRLFENTLAKAVEAGVLRGRLTAIIGSSPVHGAGAVGDTYDLVRGFLRKAVTTAGEAQVLSAGQQVQMLLRHPQTASKPQLNCWAGRGCRDGEPVPVHRLAPQALAHSNIP